MCKLLAVFIKVTCFFINHVASQYNYQQQFYENSGQGPVYQQPRHGLYYPSTDQQQYYGSLAQQYYQGISYRSHDSHRSKQRRKHSRRGGFESDDATYESEKECSCSCQQCEPDPEPCCQQVCERCSVPPNQPGIFFVPYPYPIIISGVPTKEPVESTRRITAADDSTTPDPPATTESTTISTTSEALSKTSMLTSSVITTTVKPSYPKLLKQNCRKRKTATQNKLNEDDYEPTQQKDTASKTYGIRNLKGLHDGWLPKFGIIPIPDALASKLMLQMRKMRTLQQEPTSI